METRDFPTAVILSLTSGTLFCDFSAMHEAATYLMGHPIWTHHFADKELWSEMKRTVIEQCPGFPADEIEGVTAENYLEKLAPVEAEFGKTIRIRKGSGLTARLPTDGIPDHLKNDVTFIKV